MARSMRRPRVAFALVLALVSSLATTVAALPAAGVVSLSDPSTDCPADIMLVLDGSTSISASSWQSLIDGCTDLAKSLGISADGAHLGAVQFSSASATKVELPLTGDSSTAQSTLANLKQATGGTDTGAGLEATLDEFDKDGRSDVTRIAILITDGQSNQGSDPVAVADKLKGQGKAYIFGIGVGKGANMTEISELVSTPSKEFVFELADFSQLSGIVATLVAKSCVGVTSVSPSHGDPAGGTVVVVGGYGFPSSLSDHALSSASCQFGSASTPVVAIANSSAVVCRTPAGTAGSQVVVSFAADGSSFCPSNATYTYDGGSGCPTTDCDGHGQCINDKCVCDSGWTGDNCDEKGCPQGCCGHGTCDTSTGQCTCNEGYAAPDCCEERIMCCQYCQPDPDHKGHYKPSSWRAECWKGFCPGRFPAVEVDSWQVNTTAGMDGCIFNKDPKTNRPCIYNYGDCK